MSEIQILKSKFKLAYDEQNKSLVFNFLGSGDLKLIANIDDLIKFNAILKFFINSKLKENTYHISDCFCIDAQATRNKIYFLKLTILKKIIEINNIEASMLQTYIDKFLQRAKLF
ncbi:MAG: hypothetical protein FNP40_16270 [Dehalobacter sp. 4CP]|nr:hypothetical protein [Dehalobacter sp. 4CP]